MIAFLFTNNHSQNALLKYVCVCACMQVPREGLKLLGAGITSVCELTGSELIRTWVL